MNKKVISTIIGVTLAVIVLSACVPQQRAALATPANAVYVSTAAQLTSAMQTATSGTTIYLRAGTYAAPSTGWQFTNGGVTLANYPNEQVILSSKNKTSGNYVIKCLLVSPAVDNVKIIGSDVGNQKGIVITGEALGIAPAIVGYQCDNWEIAGVEFRSVAYAIFQRKVNNGNTSADGWYVHDNFVNDYYRESGMQFNGNGNRIENNVIAKITGDSSTTYGCQLLNLLGNNNIVRGNQLERINQSVRCIGIFFEWDLADNNLIENNTIIGVPNGLSFFGGDNNIIRNNVMTGTDTAFVIRSWADGTTAYPCNFSTFMPLESDTANPDWQYMYPHDCRSKGNRFENNSVSGFATFSRIDLPEPSNIFVTTTQTETATPTNTATKTITPTPAPVNARMLIPLYIPPSYAAYQPVVDANTYQNIDVILNPNNGVGSGVNIGYATAIVQLREGGVGIYGYVYTGYGTREIAIVKSEVDKWQSWYDVDGIFVDEASNKAAGTPYIAELYDYITAKGMRVILNPGTSTIEAYMPIGDTTCIYETSPSSTLVMPSWGWNYPASKFCALQFGASISQMRSFVATARANNIGYIYVTDRASNFWRYLPPYLAEEAALLVGGVVVPTSTPTLIPPSVTLTATPSITPSRTPTRTATPTQAITITPSFTPSVTATNTVPPPGSLTCVLVTWTRGLNLRPTESMDNAPYPNMNFGYGANFPVQRIFRDADGNQWMQINEHLYAAMYLMPISPSTTGKTYAIKWSCPQG